jgi:hypothetical protein
MKTYKTSIEKIAAAALTIMLLFTNLIFAGDRSKYGTSAAPELLIPVGSRGTALGGR